MKKRLLPVLFLIFALLPEYIAPVAAIVAYAVCVRPNGKFSLTTTQKAFLSFFTYMIVGLFYSCSAVSGFASLAVWLLAFSANIAVLTFADSKEKIESLIFYTSLSGGIAGFIGALQMFLYHYGALIWKPLRGMFNPFWHLLDSAVAKLCTENLFPDGIVSMLQRTEFIHIPQRASGTFTNPVFYAMFLVIVTPFCAYCMFFATSRKRKITALFSFICSLAGIALSYSRGPYLAVAVAFICLFFYGKKQFLSLLVTAAGMAGISLAVSSGVFERLLTIFSSDDISINTRSDIWKACLEMLDGHFIFGYGTGVANVREQLHNTYSINQPHAHNLLLEILLENGIVGVLLLLCVFIIFLVRMIKLTKKGTFEKNLAVTFIASFIGFLVCSVTDYPVYGIKPLFYFMLMLALADASFSLEKPEISYTSDTKELAYER